MNVMPSVIFFFFFQNAFRPHHENEKPAFLNSSDFKSVLEKLRFNDLAVWTVGLISPA